MNKTPVNPIDLPDASENTPTGNPVINKDMSLIGHVPVTLTALIGSVSISIEKLFNLKKGEVLEMNESLDMPITLQLNGKPVARGELVAVEDNFGIRITELT
ncbi:MAG: FliM/FliN family flagellar motor switch protein [Arenimonas sp.]